MEKTIISKKIEIPEVLPVNTDLLDILRSVRALRNRYVENIETNIMTVDLFAQLEDILLIDYNWELTTKLEIESGLE